MHHRVLGLVFRACATDETHTDDVPVNNSPHMVLNEAFVMF